MKRMSCSLLHLRRTGQSFLTSCDKNRTVHSHFIWGEEDCPVFILSSRGKNRTVHSHFIWGEQTELSCCYSQLHLRRICSTAGHAIITRRGWQDCPVTILCFIWGEKNQTVLLPFSAAGNSAIDCKNKLDTIRTVILISIWEHFTCYTISCLSQSSRHQQFQIYNSKLRTSIRTWITGQPTYLSQLNTRRNSNYCTIWSSKSNWIINLTIWNRIHCNWIQGKIQVTISSQTNRNTKSKTNKISSSAQKTTW